MSETTPKDHTIILREFLVGNKAHATSSSIRAQVNCSRVRVNCSRASVKLHLNCTVDEAGGVVGTTPKGTGHHILYSIKITHNARINMF